MNLNQKGKWVLVSERTPVTQGIKITLTQSGNLGIASYVDDEWIQFLPTYLGDVYKWCEFLDEGGQEMDIMIDDPVPELPVAA